MEPSPDRSQLGAYDEPLAVEALEGEVVLTSQNGAVGVALTPSAALETAKRLHLAAEKANSDQVRVG